VKKFHFVVSLPNQNTYHLEQAAAARETALQLGGEVEILHADNDAVTQSRQVLEIVQSRAQSKPDAILFEPLTTTGLVRAAEAAVGAGIGWVVLNSDVDYLERLRGINSKVPVFGVTRDHTEIGRIQGRQFAALLPNGGTVLYVQGPANNSAAVQRTAGLESTKPANIQIKALRSNWEEASAHQAVRAWLRLSTNRTVPIGLVGCQYDGMARGARKAFEELPDRERDRWLSLPFTGVDGLAAEGKVWVDQGIMAATVVSLTTTQVAVQMLVRAMAGVTQPPFCTLIDLASYPSLEKLSAKRKHATAGA
jgi:ribose transport system substrate-binding protein